MLSKILFVMLALVSISTWAEEDGDDIAIQNCLKHWKNAPFKGHPDYRVVSTRVKVLGIGGDIEETGSTKSLSSF